MSARSCVPPLALLAAGCWVTTPDAPVLSSVHDDPNADAVTLAWAPPSRGETTGYVLEARQVPGTFQPILQAGPSTINASHDVRAVPEATDLEYRVRALPEGAHGRASNVVTHHRGLLAPRVTIVCQNSACQPVGGFVVRVQNPSVAGAALFRRVWTCPGSSGAWIPLTLAPGATDYQDADLSQWADGARYQYQAVVAAGTDRNASPVIESVGAPTLLPNVLTATRLLSGANAVQLVNPSRCFLWESVYAVYGNAYVGSILVEPGPGTSGTLVDPSPPAGRFFYYTAITDYFGRVTPGSQLWAAAATAVPGFGVTLVDRQPGTVAVRAPDGSFATAGYGAAGYAIYAPGPAGPDPLVLAPGSVPGGMLADAAGHIHALFSEPAGTEVAVVHAEHDGVSWLRRELARGPFVAENLATGLDGTLHAAWSDGAGTGLHLGRWSGGAWALDFVPGAYAYRSAQTPYAIAGDAAGGAHVVVARGGLLAHWYRDAAGWQSEPVGPRSTGALALLPGPGRLELVHATEAYTLEVIERGATGWGTPLTLDGFPVGGLQVARTSDGARLVIAARGLLWIREAAGDSRSSWPADPTSSFGLGLRPDGKIWLLDHLVGGFAPDPAVLLEER